METTTTFAPTVTRAQLSPILDAALASLPGVGERAVKAAELIVTGQVSRLPDQSGKDRWIVGSQAGQRSYTVSIRDRSCDCRDAAHGAPRHNGGPLCKHRLAAMFLFKLVGGDFDSAPVDQASAMLDAEIAAKLDEMIAAGLDSEADLLVIGDWVWLVGDVDPDLADALGCRWHDRREVHYWRPAWAGMDIDGGYNEKKDLMGLAQKYGLKKTFPRRSRRQEERTPQELAMMIFQPITEDDDGMLWA